MTRARPCQCSKSLLLILAVTLSFIGCGRKGPPVVPAAVIPPAVRDLQAKVAGRRILLTWSIPKQGDDLVEGLKRFTVFAHRQDRSAPLCPGCPVAFDEIAQVPIHNPLPARIQNGQVIYPLGFVPGSHYAFKVIVVHRSGGMSDDSNIASVRTP